MNSPRGDKSLKVLASAPDRRPFGRWNTACNKLGMQPRPRSDVFVRHLVAAATVRPMLNLLLAMKQGRVPIVSVAAPAPMLERAVPVSQPQPQAA